MNGPPVVREAAEGDLDVLAEALCDAFVDEAGLNYWLRQGEEKDRARREFFDAAVADAVHPERELWIAEAGGACLGGAIWLGPGKKAYDFSLMDQLKLAPMMLRIAGFSGMMKGFDLAEKLMEQHPREPHAHLAFIGVASAAQGRGVGSEILKRTLAPLDAAGVTAYLETTTERNVALYQRHGFEVTGEVALPGLLMWTMTRLPQR